MTVVSESSASFVYDQYGQGTNDDFFFEPVLENTIQNQRLRASTVDINSVEKGKDLL